MTIPLSKYVGIKDNYCLSYFGNDTDLISDILKSRDLIEKELPGLKIFILCSDEMRNQVYGKRNIILQSKSDEYKGKFTQSRNLEKKDDLNLFLSEAKIN